MGGLLLSQVMTLYLTPVVYTYMAALQTWWNSRHPEQEMDNEPVPGFGD